MNHEAELAKLIVPAKRSRFSEMLKSKKKRRKLVDSLYHYRDLDRRFIVPIPKNNHTAKDIGNILRKLGAPETCHIISTISEIDGKECDLQETLHSIVGAEEGTLLSCIPGVLGYYEGESEGDRYILKRTAA